MKTLTLAALAAGLVLTALPAAAAGRIERACLRSERGASALLCNCIQQVADMTLSAPDQRVAEGFFADPQEAQEIRASKDASHGAFWERYKNFGAAAEVYCAGR